MIEESLQQLKASESNQSQISRQITSSRADMKRLESRTGKAVEETAELRKLLLETCKFVYVNSYIQYTYFVLNIHTAMKVQSMQGVLSGLCEQVKHLNMQTTFATPSGYTPLTVSSADTATEQAADGSIYHVM